MGAIYKRGDVYAFFNEVSLIDQLCTTLVGKILPDGVHPSHFVIVHHLARFGNGKTPLHLANAMQVTKATMSHSLKVLEKRGFIRSIPCPRDARSKQVFLTRAGYDFHADAVAVASRTFDRFLSDEDRQTMTDALPGLSVIRRLLEENRDPPIEQDREAGRAAAAAAQ